MKAMIFKSETDTEVIPHLIEKYMDKGNNLEAAIRLAIEELKRIICNSSYFS